MQNLHYASKGSEPRLKLDITVECRLGSRGGVVTGVRLSVSHGYMGRCCGICVKGLWGSVN